MIHLAPDTSSTIISKSLCRVGGKIYLSTKDATYDAAIKKCDDFKKIMSEIIK